MGLISLDGTRLVPVPWQLIRTEQAAVAAGTAPMAFTVHVDRMKLQQAPTVERTQLRTLITQANFTQQIHNHFGTQARTDASGSYSLASPPGFASQAVARLERLTESWAAAIEFVEESDAALARAIHDGQADRVRYAAPDRVPLEVQQAGNAANGCIVGVPVSAEGRLELLWYLREQSLSIDYHRYGNLGNRADEPRAEVS